MRKTTLLCALLATALCGGAQAQDNVAYSLVTSADGLTNGTKYVLKYTGPNQTLFNRYVYEERPHTCSNLKEDGTVNEWRGEGWDATTLLGGDYGIMRYDKTESGGAPSFTADQTQYFFTLEAGDNGKFAIKSASGKYVDGRDFREVVSNKGVPVHTVSSTVNQTYFTFTWDSEHSCWNIGNGAASGRNHLNVGNGVDGGCVTLWNNAAGNDKGQWQLYAVLENAVTVTVTSQVNLGNGDERDYKSETVSTTIGASVAAPTYSYLTLAEGESETVEVTGDGQTITFTYVQDLPFETTAVANGTFPADAKWYGVDMHSNQTATNGGQYTWQYNADDARLLTPGTPKALSTGLPYEQQFCFDGNIVDGFKIYNRAAGAGMTLESTANNPTLTANNANNLWKLVKSTAIEGAFWFQQPGGTQYLNHQTENNGAIHVAKYGNADHGSSCRAFPAASFSYNYLSNFTTAPAGAVGGLTDENATAQAVEAVAAYEDNKFNSDYFADALAAVSAAASDTVAFVPGAYYRLVNVGLANGTVTYADGAANLTGNITETEALAEPGTVIRFEPVEGADGQYRLMVQGRYFGNTRQIANVVLTDAAGAPAYTIAKANAGGRFVIKDVTGGDYAYLNLQSSSRNVLGWSSGEDASRWYIMPATELTVALNSAEGSTWASLYLPFGVNLPDGLKAYTGTRNDEAQTVTLTAIDAVPAETGVILEGSEETYTLTIADVTADVANNAFTGTNQQLTDIDKAAYYTLGYGSNGLGLYHPNETTLRANVAFLQAGAQGVQGYRLMLDGTTTGIEGAPAAGAATDGTWYDLGGRRVTSPTKGVYVKNGRKVVVK